MCAQLWPVLRVWCICALAAKQAHAPFLLLLGVYYNVCPVMASSACVVHLCISRKAGTRTILAAAGGRQAQSQVRVNMHVYGVSLQ